MSKSLKKFLIILFILQVPVGDELLGRVVDALGVPMDGGGTSYF